MLNGGLNLRWNIKTGKFDRIDHWGAERAKGKNWLNRLPFLGEGRDAVVTHCGQPAKEVALASGIESLHFQADDFRSIVEISPKTKKAIQVFYFKKTPFAKTEIEELLARNTEGHTWKQEDKADSDRAWQRSDGGSSRGGELHYADGKANESSFIVISGPALRKGKAEEKQGSQGLPLKAEVEAAHKAMNEAKQQLTNARNHTAVGGATPTLPRVVVRIINTTNEADVVGEAGEADDWIAKQITRPTNTDKIHRPVYTSG